MKSLRDKKVIIVGAGGSASRYKSKILDFIEKNGIVTIGINNITSVLYPDYHLWTNKKRFKTFNQNIDNSKSKVLLGSGMSKKWIRKYYKNKYIVVDYVDEEGCRMEYDSGIIKGNFRTAGALAVMIAHVNKARNIYIVGMDGYTLYPRYQLDSDIRNQHCYGSGFTDDASWDECIKKDEAVYETLNEMKQYGVKFSILTPTKFENFYDPSILEIKGNQ